MKWSIAPLPVCGERRIRHVFAFFPTRVNEHTSVNTKVWLERYWVIEQLEFSFEYGATWCTISRHLDEPELVAK